MTRRTRRPASRLSFLLRWVVPALGAAAALALVFWLYRDLRFDRLVEGLRRAEPGWIAVLALAILLEQVANGWKWRQILHDVKPVRTLRLTGALLAGYAVNVLVPLGVSPLVRSWLVARIEGLRMGTVLATTIVARFLDGVVFALFAGLVAASGRVTRVEGDLRLGLSVAGLLNLLLFGGLLWVLFRYRSLLSRDGPLLCGIFDWVAARLRADGPRLRASLGSGIVWPRSRGRRLAAIGAAVAGKLVAATHFVWAGLAAGVVLTAWDYLFLMVFAGFVMVLGRFVRIPGSFVFGAGFALKALGVADEQALLMILFNYGITIAVVVGIGLVVLWQSGLDIRHARAGTAPEDLR